MSFAQFEKILEYLERSDIQELRLLGGEPTLHPHIIQMVDHAYRQGFKVLLFTNGLIPGSVVEFFEKFLENGGSLNLLINMSGFLNSSQALRTRKLKVIDRLASYSTLGINIDHPGINFDFLHDLYKKYSTLPTFRFGLAHPCLKTSNQYLHPTYYPAIGKKLHRFFQEKCKSDHIGLEFDCGFVPCMFSGGALESMGKTASEIGRRCNPLTDILINGDTISCYPLFSVAKHTLTEKCNSENVQQKFNTILAPYRKLGIYKKCSICKHHHQGDCVGGCLALAIKRLNPVFHTTDVVSSNKVKFSIEEYNDNSNENDSKLLKKEKDNIHHAGQWIIPYIDQPMSFWENLFSDYGNHIKEVYCPLPLSVCQTGRPLQKEHHLGSFLAQKSFPISILMNPVVFLDPVEDIAHKAIPIISKLMKDCELTSITVSNVDLAKMLKKEYPSLKLTASVLLDVFESTQLSMLDNYFDTLVPSSRIMRNIPSLKNLRNAFQGKIRIIVNEGCLSGCLWRNQHFYEMANKSMPESLCQNFLESKPWMRLTGAWVLPQHLYLFDDVVDEFKIAGRVTLNETETYEKVVSAYIQRTPLGPDSIGGGPASPFEPIEINERFYKTSTECSHNCNDCKICRDYYHEFSLNGLDPMKYENL